MARRSKVLLASLVLAIAVIGIVPAIGAASPRDALSGDLQALKLRAGLKSLAVGAAATDDDIPGVPIPASPFSDTLQAPEFGSPGGDPMDVYSVPLTAGQSFYVEEEAADNLFFMLLFSPGTTSINSESAFDNLVGMGFPGEGGGLMYVAEQTGTYYLAVLDFSDPVLASPAAYTLTYGYPAKAPVITTGFASRNLPYGGSTTVTGTVSFEGAPLGDTTVVLLSKVYGAADWSYSRDVTTTSEGTYIFTLKPSTRTAYMLFSMGDFEYKDAATTPAWVYVKPQVGNPGAPSVMYVNRAASVWAFLKPRHTAGSYPVRIYKYRYVNGAWKSYGYVTAKAANYSSYTKATASVKLPYRGRWRLRAYHADGGHLATYSSGYDYVTVK